jgi:hypothetical protein
MGTQYAFGQIVMDGLVLCLNASDRNSYVSGSTTWNDVSGRGNNGTLTNGPTFNSLNGGNIVFDGSDDFADLPIPLAASYSTITVDAWIKWNSFTNGMFLGMNTYDVWTQGNTLGYNNGASNVIGINAATVTSLGLLGNWKHYAFVMNSSGLLSTNKMYINSQSQTLTAVVGGDGNIPGLATTLRLSSWLIGGFYGNVSYANCKVYNRALTAQEVLQNYNATKSRFGII